MSNVIDITKTLTAALASHLGLLFSQELDATSLSCEESIESIKVELEVYAGGSGGRMGMALFFGETSIGFDLDATTARALADALWEGADRADAK